MMMILKNKIRKLVMKIMFMMGCLFVQGMVLAESSAVIYPVPPSKMAEFNAKTGGMIEPPENSKKVVLFDARTYDQSVLTNLAQAAENQLFLTCEVRKLRLEEKDDPIRIALSLKKGDVGAVLLFCERESYPTLSAFPEDCVAVVNLTPFQSPDYATYRRRLVREFWRGLGFALGGYGNQVQSGGVMQPVYSIADLDNLPGFSISPMGINSIVMNKVRVGIHRKNPVPYSRACREGWAPHPTNDVQRALYDRFMGHKTRYQIDAEGRTTK